MIYIYYSTNLRRFTPYETNQLLKFGFNPFDLEKDVDLNIPVEYLTGKVEFRGRIFAVNKNTLIPRTETEELVSIALQMIARIPNKSISFADIGSGSGVIGISICLELLKKNIDFEAYLSDISSEALEVIRKNLISNTECKQQNCFTNKIKNSQIKIIKSDLLSNYPKSKRFDFILANLPYIPSSRINILSNSVKDFEPITALDGGYDGLVLIRQLMEQAKLFLIPEGYLVLEVDDTHDEIRIKEFSLEWNIEIKKDLNGKYRYWICQLK